MVAFDLSVVGQLGRAVYVEVLMFVSKGVIT